MDKPVSILYLSSKPDLSRGGQRSLLHLLERLDRSRFTPVVIVPGPGSLARAAFKLKCRVFYLDWPALHPGQLPRLLDAARRFRHILKEVKPAIIHADAPRNAHFTAWLRGPVKLVMHLRVSTPDGFSDKLLALEADRLIAVSRGVAQRFTGIPMAHRKLRVIHNAVNPDVFTPASTQKMKLELRREFDLPRKKVLVGFLAGFVPLKRHDFILDLWPEVIEKAPDICLILAGDQPVEERNRIAQRIQNEGLERWVKMIDFVEHPDRLLPALDLVLLPSTEEGFNRVLLEAGACGLPAVASNIPAIEEAVRHEHTGALVELNDRATWINTIARFANDREMRHRMGTQARQYVEQRFSLERQVRLIMTLYDRMLEGRR